MKVLWFANTPANADEYFVSELKGTGGWLKALDQELQKHIDLHVAFYSSSDLEFKHKNTTYHAIKTNVSFIKKVINKVSGNVPNYEDLDKYLSIIQKVSPDLIHIHGTEQPFTAIINKVKIPVVVSIQGIITVIHNKYLAGFELKYLYKHDIKFNRLKDLIFPKSYKNTYNHFKKVSIRETHDLKHVSYILGRTLWDRRVTRVLAPNSMYFQDDRVLRDSFYHVKWNPHIRNNVVLHTTMDANFYKGLETICHTLTLLNNIGLNATWQIAGVSDTDFIVKLVQKKLKKRYTPQSLIFLGKINEKDLIGHMLKADIYVMASHIENNANNLCEAMMLGMPCISTFAGGVGSLIRDGNEGILIQDGDPWAMAGVILEITQDKEKAIELGENARIVALKRHDKERIVKDLIHTYQRIIIDSNN